MSQHIINSSTSKALAGQSGCGTDNKAPRLWNLLDEISNEVHCAREAMQSATAAGYRIGSSSRLTDSEPSEERPVSDSIEDRLQELLRRVHDLSDKAREIRDHLDSLA